MESKFLDFQEIPNEGKKTKRFLVTDKIGDQLGMISWSGPWRKYVYHTTNALYDTKCLLDIVKFIDLLMEERKK